MADDIFLTAEEQDERAKKWLRENGPAILIGIVLGLGGIYGYDEYRIHQIKQSERAALAYSELLEIHQGSDVSDVALQVDTLKDEFSSTPYAAKAALIKAKQLASTDLDAAISELDWVLGNTDERSVWHSANIRKAKILIEQSAFDQALESATLSDYEGFASQYLELQGDALLGKSEYEEAQTAYTAAIDALSPASQGYARILQLKLNRAVAPASE